MIDLIKGELDWHETINSNFHEINSDKTGILTTLDEHTTHLNDNANEINNIKTDYAKKTEVNELASSKAEKSALNSINQEVVKNSTNITTLSNQIASLVAPNPSADNAETADVRNGNDGIVYASAGDSVRKQFTNIFKYASQIRELFKNISINLLDKNNMMDEKALSGQGVVVEQSGCSVTNDYLYLQAGEMITVNFNTYNTIFVYDANKKYKKIIKFEENSYTYIATEDCYLRFNVYTAKKDEAMVVFGDTLPSTYLEYGKINLLNCLNINNLKVLIDNNMSVVDDNKKRIDNLLKENFYYNLIDLNNLTDFKYINPTGNEQSQDDVCYTNEYFYLELGESITINFGTHFTIAVYDENKIFEKIITLENEDAPYTYTAESNCYVRFNIYLYRKNDAIAIYGNFIPRNELGNAEIGQNKLRYKGNISGNCIQFGDSIAHGDRDSKALGFMGRVALRNPNMTLKNTSVCGATLCRRTSDKPGVSILDIVDSEIALEHEYDRVFIEGGANDGWNQNTWPLGSYTISSYTDNLNELTIYGAFESTIRKVQNRWPNALTYFIIPHNITPDIHQVMFDNMIEICKKYGVIVIDIRFSGMNIHNNTVKATYTVGDGTHPNNAGYYKYYVPLIESILKRN